MPAAGEAGRRSPRRTSRDERRRTHGQNFLRDASLVRDLVAEAGISADDVVVEPGAGTGVITKELAARARRVVAIELDPVWGAKLQERFAGTPHVEVLTLDFFDFELPRTPYRVFANIPFGRTTQVLRFLLDDPARGPQQAHLFVQYEVARKHSRVRGPSAATLSWQPWYEFEVARRIPAAAFRPVPRVDAALLAITKRPHSLLPVDERPEFLRVVAAAFSHRIVWDGLRTILTRNQVRQIRRHTELPEDLMPAGLAVSDWVRVFDGVRRFRSG